MTEQITPQDTQKVLDLCSGIGGFTLGHLISGGFETVAFCEINSYCQQVLNLRFPQIPIIPNIHDITTESLARIGVREVDGIIAGLPCPPFSLAGKREASKDERNLFGEFFRIICEIRPHWAIVENVPGLLTAEGSGFFRAVLFFEQDCRQRELEQAILGQQNLNQQLQHRLKAVEVEQDRVNTPCGHKYSVVGFANLQGLEISVKVASTKGRKASALCRKQGIEIERIHDPRFGKVGLYPESVLVEVFKAEQN
jgi:C-5 cytosine-specific DNA methylase